MFGKECDGCRLRDETIADLRGQLNEAMKTTLSVIDSRAYVLRYQAARGAAREPLPPAEQPATTPAEMRRRRWDPPMDSAEVERTFQVQSEQANHNAVATTVPEP